MPSPQITLSATGESITGTSQMISITATLIDPNSTGNLRVSGSIIPGQQTSTVTPGTTATVGPIFGNDVIEDGFGNLNGTYYKVQVFTVTGGIQASTPSLQNFYAFTGSGTVDLSTATPLAPSFQTGTLGSVTVPNTIAFNGATSGDTVVQATAIASGTLTLPAATDQLVARATADTLTNKAIGSGGLGGIGASQQTFASSGTFTIPAGITKVKVTAIGGGGSGGGSTNTNYGSGGGSGACAIKWLSGLTPGNTLTVVVGAGGAGASAGGNSGVASTVSSGTQTISTITAGGGGGGLSQNSTPNGGAGGNASGGDLNITGNVGGASWATNLGGAGAGSILGGWTFISGGAGQSPLAPGGGSSGCGGATNNSSVAGAAGIVIFDWAN